MKLIGFTSWHNENYKFIGDLEDEQFGENDIQWMNYEERAIFGQRISGSCPESTALQKK